MPALLPRHNVCRGGQASVTFGYCLITTTTYSLLKLPFVYRQPFATDPSMSTTPSPSSTEVKWASAPFNKPTADVILQSSDNVYFRVRKGILAEASSVFDDLFAHATPAPNASLRCGDEMIDGVPVIAMTETSSVLTFILHLYYPPYEVVHSLGTMDDAFGAMEAVRKYMMPHAQKVVAKQFELFAERDAMRVYIEACKRHLQDEMEIAARASICTPLVHKTVPELAHITAMDYCILLQYREAYSAALSRIRQRNDLYPYYPRYHWLTMKSFLWREVPANFKGTTVTIIISEGAYVFAPGSWDEYMSKTLELLAMRPNSKIIYDVPSSMLLYSALKDCNSAQLKDIVLFQKEFAAAVDEAIATVTLSSFQ